MYFNFDLRGLVPTLSIIAIFSIMGIWKMVEIIVWLINHIKII